MSEQAERFGIEYVHPMINYRERDGEPTPTFESAIVRAKAKADSIVTLSSGRLKVLNEVRDDDAQSYKVNLGFANGGNATGGYIEVNLIPQAKGGLAVTLRGGLEELATRSL